MTLRTGFRFAYVMLAALVHAGAAQAATGSDRMTLRVGVQADLKILDPVITTSRMTALHGLIVYETLFAMDSHHQPKPEMVESYRISPDKLTYTFTLRPEKWHDGSPVRSIDCVASLKRWMQHDAMGLQLTKFAASLDIVDDRTFTLKLKEPYGLVLQTLGKDTFPAFMMPERLAKTPVTRAVSEVDGSGPFMFKTDEWHPGSKFVYVRNPNYVPRDEPPDGMAGGHVAKVERIEFSYLPDPNSALSALTVGEIDYLDEVPFDFFPIIKANPDIKLVFINLGNPGFIRPNFLQPPFNDRRAREALAYLVDQEEFMGAAVGDHSLYMKFCGAYFICGSANGSEAGSEPYRHKDVAKAKALFAQAGYKGQPIVVLQSTDRTLYKAWTQVLIQDLRDAGLAVDEEVSDWASIMVRWQKKIPPADGGWNIVIGASPPGAFDPFSSFFFYPGCDKGIQGWPCDPVLLKIIDDWARETDAVKQRELIAAINERGWYTLPFILIGQYRQPVAVRSNIEGVLNAGGNVFWNISKK